jgi:hypothetical protein
VAQTVIGDEKMNQALPTLRVNGRPGAMTDPGEIPQPVPTSKLRRWIGNAEGWLAVVIAAGSWVWAFQPVYPHVGQEDLKLIELWRPSLLFALGVGLALGGIRFGGSATRVAAYWAVGLLTPLILMMVWIIARILFR